MAIQSILRNRIVSPTRAAFQSTTTTRSLLKRPDRLLLSPHSARSVVTAEELNDEVTSLEKFNLFSPKPFRSTRRSQTLANSLASYPRSPYPFAPFLPAEELNDKVTSFGKFKLSEPPKPFRSTRHSQTLAHSLASYPRSPYPSAPFVPTEELNDEVTEDDLTQRVRASSLELPKRNKKGLTLGFTSVTSVAPTPSSLGRSVFSPSINEGKIHASNDLESRLSEAFWKALSLEQSDEEVMYTALEHPSSGAVPEIMYGSADGAVWSPALPKPGVAVNRIRESLMSSKRSSFSVGFVRKDFTAPTPNDPFAAFPSFTAVMEVDSGITYPSRVVLE